jgi:hypothetical protein
MPTANTFIAFVVAAAVSGTALGQGADATVQRNVNQQQRIEQGLQSGQLTTGEAARLERQETRIETMQGNALKDGTLTSTEKARLKSEQDAVSADIYKHKHDVRTANPDSAASRRMQADVRRNIDQQARIDRGMKTGQLTSKEAAGLERGQAQVTAREAAAGADGHVGRAEQRNVQASQNRQSARIYRKKYNSSTKPRPAA